MINHGRPVAEIMQLPMKRRSLFQFESGCHKNTHNNSFNEIKASHSRKRLYEIMDTLKRKGSHRLKNWLVKSALIGSTLTRFDVSVELYEVKKST